MKRLMTFLAAIFTVTMLAYAGYVMAVADEKPIKVLQNFRLRSLEGDEITLDGQQLAGKRVAFVFMASWSELCKEQARQVLDYQGELGGTLVFICQGPERDVRDLREQLGAASHLWLKSESKVSSDFSAAFDDMKSLDRVPALLVVDEGRKVAHASSGELSTDEVKKALSAKAK